MARLNDFMTRIDLSVMNDYIASNGKNIVYTKGDRIVQQGHLFTLAAYQLGFKQVNTE